MQVKKWGLLLLLFITTLFVSPVLADDSYTIKVLDVNVSVDENGLVSVNESFTGEFDHCTSFFWEIGNTYRYEWMLDGQEVYKNFHWALSDFDLSVYNYNLVESENDTYVYVTDEIDGEVKFSISYKMQLVDLGVGDAQQFGFFILPSQPTEIGTINYRITMPKIFDIDSIVFIYDGMPIIEESESKIHPNYAIEGTSIVGYIDEGISSEHTLELKLDLVSDYFKFPDTLNIAMIIVIVCIILIVLTILAYILFGRDGLIVKAETHLPPDGINAGSVHYICDGNVTYNDVALLILEWADQGYLQIEEVSDPNNLYLVKLKPMGKEKWKYERTLFNALFYNREEVFASELDRYFYPYAFNAIREIENIYSKVKHNRVFTKSSLIFQLFNFFLTIIPIFVGSLYAFYYYYYYLELATMFAVFITLIALILELIWYYVVSHRNLMKRITYYILLLGCVGISFLAAYWYNYAYSVCLNTFGVCYITMLTYAVEVWAMLFMDKRTAVGKAWYGELLGLKDFITNASREELQAELDENPDYFYFVLPYAYTLGVSDVWFKKFYGFHLELPEWYICEGKEELPLRKFSTRYYRIIHILNHHLNAAHFKNLSKSKKEKKKEEIIEEQSEGI